MEAMQLQAETDLRTLRMFASADEIDRVQVIMFRAVEAGLRARAKLRGGRWWVVITSA